MAGGIDWFRWHHGTVKDQKFTLIARRSGASVAEVIAVWACLLERASESDERGSIGSPDFESMDCALGMEDGRAESIFAAMRSKDMIDAEARLTAWSDRQPKKEDESATDRKRAQRERDAAAKAVTNRDNVACHAVSHDVTLEKRREEEIHIEPNGSRRQADLALPPCPHDQIVGLYHEHLPELPAVRLMSESRQKSLRGFWRWVLTSRKSDGQPRAQTVDQALTWIGNYFERAKSNDFLMGRRSAGQGHDNWRCDLDFLLTEKGKKHVIEKTVDA